MRTCDEAKLAKYINCEVSPFSCFLVHHTSTSFFTKSSSYRAHGCSALLLFRKDDQLPPFFPTHSEKCRHNKFMSSSSCRRLQNKFTVDTWTENPPSSTSRNNPEHHLCFLLQHSGRISPKSIWTVSMSALSFGFLFLETWTQRAYAASFAAITVSADVHFAKYWARLSKPLFEKYMSGAFCLSKRMTDLLHGAVLAVRTPKQKRNDFMVLCFQNFKKADQITGWRLLSELRKHH